MQKWKEEILTQLNKQAIETREIKFQDVAALCGYKHINTQDCQDIINKFLKGHTTYRLVQFLNTSQMTKPATQSLFTTAVLTECDYD